VTDELPQTDPIREIVDAFEREIGITGVEWQCKQVGPQPFLKIKVGREAPLYKYALRRAQLAVPESNPFRGSVGLDVKPEGHPFPRSAEANSLLTLITRSTREVAQGIADQRYTVPYIPFHNREDHLLAQPATHIVRGRRGVGKSTLIGRAVEILGAAKQPAVILDMQSYATLSGDELLIEVLTDVCLQFGELLPPDSGLKKLADQISSGELGVARAPAAIKRALSTATTALGVQAFLFLDDFHLIPIEGQPRLLQYLHGALKGANGWLKVAGITSLLNIYSPATREGLQVPGDAQFIALDLTLEDPEAAASHLRQILGSFLYAVGFSLNSTVMPNSAFSRLVWATAGVPRDFLQMFARALEHAQRNKHSSVTVSDVNIAIGEFGQQKMDDLIRDARNEADELKDALNAIEKICLDERKVNAFLVRSEDSKERKLVHALSDLRMVHLINRSITPDRAGERYEAYIIDYSIFTGFRRRPGVTEMIPSEGQFKASELRALPKLVL
jgi:hypothetical protein